MMVGVAFGYNHGVSRCLGIVFLWMVMSSRTEVIAQSLSSAVDSSTVTGPQASVTVPTTTFCDSSPCANGGECVEQQTGFLCNCVGDFTGDLCDRAVNVELFASGLAVGDTELRTAAAAAPEAEATVSSDDGQTSRQWVDQGVQIYGHRYRNFFISVNGYMTFLTQFLRFTPWSSDTLSSSLDSVNQAPVMLAPFWADAVTSEADGAVYYHSYTKDSPAQVVDDNTELVINKATSIVRAQSGNSVFSASYVQVVTWTNMSKVVSDGISSETSTFQLALISDHATYDTYVQYNYQDLGWTPSADNAIFTYARTSPDSANSVLNTYALSGTPSAVLMPGIYGNTNQRGSLLYRLTEDRYLEYHGAEYQCRVWSVDQENQKSMIQYWAGLMNIFYPCPCTLSQVLIDPRFIYSYVDLCFVSRTLVTQRCCYDRYRPFIRSLPFIFFPTIILDHPLMTSHSYGAGSLALYSPIFQPFYYEQEDRAPKAACCLGADMCHIFYQYRPMNLCWTYIGLSISWMFGDPHIQTPDGKAYTYNGRGEFWLQKPIQVPEDDFFRLQGRTDTAWDSEGQEQQATVFVAVAAADKDTGRVHIGLSDDRQRLVIRVNDGEDLADWYYNTTDEAPAEQVLVNVVLRRFTDSVYVSFPSGVAVKARPLNNQLDVVFIANENYTQQGNRGLFGIYNGDPSDDLTTPDGTVISSNKSEDLGYIHTEFGEQWRIGDTESLFWYADGTTTSDFQDPGFEPVTELAWGSVEEEQQADELCQGDLACLYDLFVTKDTTFATSTLDTGDKNEVTEIDAKNNVPLIDGPTELEIMVLEAVTATITVSDADSDDTVTLTYTIPEGATYDVSTGLFEWTPQDMSEVEIIFSAVDSKGAEGPDLTITVKLCNCSDHGTCDFANPLPEYNTTDTFQIVYCDCQIQWSGDFCESDLDACEAQPCLTLQDCTDMSPAVHTSINGGFTCGDCPAGYVMAADISKCLDIDECLNGTDNCDLSTTECVNTIGSFSCDCLSGYEPVVGNTTSCGDIDECELLLDDCEHKCTNGLGGYICECYGGYILDVNGTCIVNDTEALEPCNSVTCESGVCVVSGGDAVCNCPSGFELAGDDVTCNDIDECTVDSQGCGTIGHPNCTNIEGSYECECLGGTLSANRRSCEVCDVPLWGTDCAYICDCANDTTVCDPVTGCSACRPGWAGGECKEDVDECAEDVNPCSEYSTCNNTIGSYSCLCDVGYERVLDSCNEIDECEPGVEGSMAGECLNGAQCVDGFLNVTCICTDGYEGDRCENNIDECLVEECLHNSTCVDKVYSVECICLEGYYGHYCQYIAPSNGTVTAPEEGDLFPVLPVVLGVVIGSALLILLVIGIYTCVHKYRRRQPERTAETSDSTFSRPSHMMPAPQWLHWYQGVGKPFSSTGGPQVPSRAGTGQQRPPTFIDWTVLRKAANRQSNLRPSGHQPSVHRGPAPYSSPGWYSGASNNSPPTSDGQTFGWQPT